ncbi:MAG: energy transducer TonB [Candidatus Acidiferrales bacterium]
MRTHHDLSDSFSQSIDRRVYVRVPIKSVAYIDLGQENGGLILNVSEGGVAMHAAEIVEGATFEKMRFQLPNSERWIEAGGKLVWHGHSKKKAGVQFVNLSDEARRQIRDWTDSADIHPDESVSGVAPKPGKGREAPGSFARSEDSGDPASEFDLAFPSENPGEAEVPAGQAPQARVVAPVDDPESATNHAPRPASRAQSSGPSIEEREFRDKPGAPPPTTAAYDDADSSRKAPWSAPRNPMFDLDPRPDPFAGIEYRTGGSEGWARRNWLAVVTIVLAIFVIGGVLAVGPSNVKALVVEKLSPLVQAPPPQTKAVDNTPPQSALPATPPAGNSELPPAPSPAPSSASTAAPAENGADASDQNAKAASVGGGASQRAAAQVPATKANPAIHSESSDDGESAEEITRRFQLEHRDTPVSAEATNRPVAEMNPEPPPQDAQVPVNRDVPASSDEPETGQSSQTASTVPTGMPAGLVTISSHFQAVQGVAPDQLPDGGRPVVGQLVSIQQPVYPAEAFREHVEGTVQLRLVVDQLGHVEAVYVVSGPPLLVPAAIRAAREWRYNGTLLDSRRVKCVEDVAMVFRLANSLESPRN